ncbi:MAG TPA: hypothetical protein DD417_07060 [Elusimicrobia bacterium]|nr:hypothetical protein [Elusimicrobiota bacterium]
MRRILLLALACSLGLVPPVSARKRKAPGGQEVAEDGGSPGRKVRIWKECPDVGMAEMESPLAAIPIGTISPYEVSRALKAGEPIELIDVRTREDFGRNHFGGARNVSYDDLADAPLPKGRNFVLYCMSCCCPEAAWAASAFLSRGAKNVSVMRGGLEEPGDLVVWQSQGVGELEAKRLVNLPCGEAREAVVELEEKIRLNQVPPIEFELDKAILKTYSKVTLKYVADILVRHPELRLKVAGHTCILGTEEYNQELSERRAGAVKSYLVRLGVSKSAVDAHGYGVTRPRGSNETEEGRRRNRRVEFLWIQPD